LEKIEEQNKMLKTTSDRVYDLWKDEYGKKNKSN
jgi:hypothetical protein